MQNNTHILPAISVVMPMYNAASYVGACMDSVLSQSFKDFEFVIVDDVCNDKCQDKCQVSPAPTKDTTPTNSS